MAKRNALAVPLAPPDIPPPGRAIELPLYLQRLIPQYGAPGWLQAAQWRQFVRNQPLATVCRDTLINGIKALEWDIVPVSPEDATNPLISRAITYYRDLFEHLDGGFDLHMDMMSQDYLDLPFGGAAEVITEDDDPDGPVLAVEHIDAATLWPTLDDEYPVAQMVPDVPAKAVAFPRHAIRRMIYSPRPELRRKGWGMAPPEKIYLAVEMLYRGDMYYWKLLLDTPEAGILDLLDMDKEDAIEWLASMREMFGGLDPMKVPVLYQHEKAAVWIPFGRPPADMLYDKATLHYAQVLAGGYGMRISDIGLDEARGGGTLAGVIRAERQTRRSGHANLRESLRNYFNSILPRVPLPVIKFIWVERDDEAMVARGRAMLAVAQGLGALIGGQMLNPAEGRQEIVNLGILESKIDPNAMIAAPASAGGRPVEQFLLELLGPKYGKQPPPEGGAEPTGPKPPDNVPPSQGGRGDQSRPVGLVGRVRSLFRRRDATLGEIVKAAEDAGADVKVSLVPRATPYGENPATRDAKSIEKELAAIILPGMKNLPDQAQENNQARVRKLVEVATRRMVPQVEAVVKSLDDDMIQGVWLPNMNAITFGQESELDAIVTRQADDEIQDALEAILAGESWWQLANVWDRQAILEAYSRAYELGIEDMALTVLRSLYQRGLAASPTLPGLSFTLMDPRVLEFLEMRAGDLVTNIDSGTVTFIKRIITAGVRQGISSPEIAQALRDGATAEEILGMEGFTARTMASILSGLEEMSEARTNSIVNYEIAWAENAGRHEQMVRSGFREKAWVHLGARGITEAGNPHPCALCESNEALGFVPIDTLYETVFEPTPYPPAHPTVCHCGLAFNPGELDALVAGGGYAPWVGA
jgi:hypothetical protein